MARAWLGMDLGGTNTRLGLVGEGGILARRHLPTRADEGPQAWLERVVPVLQELMTWGRGEGLEITGLGVASAGVLEREEGRILFSPNLPRFDHFPLGQRLAAATGLEVVVENDANCYALGEHLFGAGRGEDLACFTLGTGVGGGLVLGGRLQIGPLGIGGELGHLVVEPGGRLCGCGAQGCLEAYASATALKAMLNEALAGGRWSRLQPGKGVKAMERAAVAGDELAQELMHTAGTMLGRAAAMVAVATGVELVVIGGGLARGWFLLEPAARAELERTLCLVPARRLRLVRSALEDDAPLMGAAALAQRQ